MEFQKITAETYPVFHQLLNDYYRNGEDADTEQSIVDTFIRQLFDLTKQGGIQGRLACIDGVYGGFVLWMKDTAESEFSQLPGWGVILEIGLRTNLRKRGLGRELVRYAERQLRAESVEGLYVEAYGKAQGFWEKCGYAPSGEIAFNGLPVFVKKSCTDE